MLGGCGYIAILHRVFQPLGLGKTTTTIAIHGKHSARIVQEMVLSVRKSFMSVTNIARGAEPRQYLGSMLASLKPRPNGCNMLHATCCAGFAKRTQHCTTWWPNARHMLRAAIVWPGLKYYSMCRAQFAAAIQCRIKRVRIASRTQMISFFKALGSRSNRAGFEWHVRLYHSRVSKRAYKKSANFHRVMSNMEWGGSPWVRLC